ncbi:uncharacterized protein LOC18018712 [Eutrema salsugineum]|uniref:uncharacterized protein LOC18018712 n=1 Tax=Eutrema salsugineum TaxID=72664 RepID=UPI000CECE6DF|nr:uncharacterized protein LOC18018712 [Eutrema salsugineum]
MGIDAKESCAIIWKIIGFSMNTSIKFMRNHPVLTGVSIFLLALYILLPSLLFFLIYSSPVLACAVVYAREKLGLRFSTSHKPFPSPGPKSTCGGGDKKCHLRQQRSVRRNARMKVEEWDSQTSEEEKDKVILTSLYNDLLGRTPHFEESPKAEVETPVAEEDNDDKSFAEQDSGTSSLDSGDLKPRVCNCEINEDGEFDGKEEMMSNVNEHGISEIERNRRLESLIARRRTRRLFKLALDQRNKLQGEETTTPTQSNSLQVTVPRNNNNNPFEKRRNYPWDTTVTGLQVPGSAPSVMLQGRNPFDIPYDPQEERPNLTGDSFDQEFSLFNHKDIFFCRHESFCRFALFSPEHAQCMNSPVAASDISATRKRLDLDNEYMDHTEQNLPCNGKEASIEVDDNSVESGKYGEREVEMNDETDSNKEEGANSSCSEESESELSRFNNAELREAICHSMDNYPGFLVNQTRNTIPSTLPRGLVAPRLDDNNVFYARRCANSHSRTFSVASDMQVEVSEVGSPPTTVDWLDDWSNGGESYTYDTDIDREIIRGEESRKRVSSQCESRSGIGSKGENSEPGTKPDQKGVADEPLRTIDDMSLLDRRNQTEENLEPKPSSSNDVSNPTSSGKFEGLLFHTSASLSSITEEPESILDSIIGANSDNCLTKELTDHISLTSLDSSTKKSIDDEVVDVQQLKNDDLCGSPKVIGSNIIDLQQKDQILNSIQGEYESTQSFSGATLDTPCIESSEREIEEEEEPNLDNFPEELTKQTDNEVRQSDLKSSPGHVLTKLLESEVMEENGPEIVKNIDKNAKPMEQEKTHDVLEASSSHSHTQLVEDYGNAENDSDVILLQVQDGNDSILDESTDQEFSKEGDISGLLKEFYAETIQDCNNKANDEEESIVSEDNHNSQSSQPCTQQRGINSSEGISPRTLENTQQPAHDDDIAPNTVSQDIVKDTFSADANDPTAAESHDEENLKPDEQVGEAMEKELELNLESMDHKTSLIATEDDEESKKLIGAVHKADTETTKDSNRVLG